jgi:hypothetical protein
MTLIIHTWDSFHGFTAKSEIIDNVKEFKINQDSMSVVYIESPDSSLNGFSDYPLPSNLYKIEVIK